MTDETKPSGKPAAIRRRRSVAKPVATNPAGPAGKTPAPKLPTAAVSARKARGPATKDMKMDATTKTVADKVQADAKTMFADAGERTKAAMAKGSQSIADMNEFTKGNIEAMVESTRIYAKGVEAIGQDAAAFARKSFEDATAAFKSMAAVKSPTDFLKIQGDYVRSAFDAMVAETSKSTEKMVKLASEAAQPISNRVALATEKMKIAA